MGFRKPTIGLKGYTLKTLGKNIDQNQARDEEILPPFFFQKKLASFFSFLIKKIAMFLHIVQTNIQGIKIFLINLMCSF
jgi:hypothetical protein